MDDEAREKGRQHDLQIAEYKRKIDLAIHTVGDEMAEKMLLMQEEHENELRPMREQTDVTMHDVIRKTLPWTPNTRKNNRECKRILHH